MTRDVLKDASGNRKLVDAWEGAVLTAVIRDEGNVAITKAQISGLTFTLIDRQSGAIINNRNKVNVFDANDGSVANDGTVTIKLQSADNPHSGAHMDDVEEHIAVLRFTWLDGDSDTRDGAKQWIIEVLASAR